MCIHIWENLVAIIAKNVLGDLLKDTVLHTSMLNNSTLSIKYKRNNDHVKALIERGLDDETKSDLTLNKEQLKEINFNEWIWVDVRGLYDIPVLNNTLIKRIPISNIEAPNNGLNTTSNVICFCKSGIQSVIAAKLLKKKGIKKVLAFTGSIAELQEYEFFNGKNVR